MMAQCKSVELRESGHFECNGFAAKLEGKHLSIEVVNNKIKVTYDAGVFTHDEINLAINHVLKVNEFVSRSSMEKF